jgi:hypothetical protein
MFSLIPSTHVQLCLRLDDGRRTPKVPYLTHTVLLFRLINGLNAVICGERFARVCPISGTIDQVNEHRDDFINITD